MAVNYTPLAGSVNWHNNAVQQKNCFISLQKSAKSFCMHRNALHIGNFVYVPYACRKLTTDKLLIISSIFAFHCVIQFNIEQDNTIHKW